MDFNAFFFFCFCDAKLSDRVNPATLQSRLFFGDSSAAVYIVISSCECPQPTAPGHHIT